MGRQYSATVALSCRRAAANSALEAAGGQLPRSSPDSGWKVVEAPWGGAGRQTCLEVAANDVRQRDTGAGGYHFMGNR